MTLKLIDASPDPFARIKIVSDSLLTVDLCEEAKGEPLYLMVEPDEQTILEFTLEAGTGLLNYFRLVTIPRRRVTTTQTDLDGPMIPTDGRRPAFSLDAWPPDISAPDWKSAEWKRRFVEVKDDFALIIGPSTASLHFTAREQPVRWVVNTRVRFGFDADGQLSRIDLFNLKADEVSTLNETVSHLA